MLTFTIDLGHSSWLKAMSSIVECPICSQLVPSSSINAHIDSGCSTTTAVNTPTESPTKQKQLNFSSPDTKKASKHTWILSSSSWKLTVIHVCWFSLSRWHLYSTPSDPTNQLLNHQHRLYPAHTSHHHHHHQALSTALHKWNVWHPILVVATHLRIPRNNEGIRVKKPCH